MMHKVRHNHILMCRKEVMVSCHVFNCASQPQSFTEGNSESVFQVCKSWTTGSDLGEVP